MSIFRSKQKAYNAKAGKYTLIWQLNTNNVTVFTPIPKFLQILVDSREILDLS